MASIGYEYEPETDEENNTFPQHDEGVLEDDEEVCYSTKLEELDQMDLVNRNSDHINQVVNPEVFNPDPLDGKQLFVKTVPEGGVKTHKPTTVDEIQREREDSIQELTQKENDANFNEFEKKKLRNMSLKDFIQFLADSYLNILNDLLEINSLDDFIETFTKEDRLVAVGVLFLSISIFFIFFNQV